MQLLKCKNGAILILDGETGAYWVITSICGNPTRLFAGGTPEKANNTFNYYANGENKERMVA